MNWVRAARRKECANCGTGKGRQVLNPAKGVVDYDMIMQSKAYRGWNALRLQLEEKGLSQNEVKEAEASFYKGVEALSHLFFLNHKIKTRFRRRKRVSF